MSDFLPYYVDWGLTDIVVVSTSEREVESGYNPEITRETVVARKAQGFIEVIAKKEFRSRLVVGVRASGGILSDL